MKTSIIIPTLNRNKHLKKVLNSILDNSITIDEIIIINQSSYSLNKLVSTFPKLHIIILNQNIKSSSIARNYGVKKSSGDILFFLDDDIIIDKNYIKNSIKFLKENNTIKGLSPVDLDLKDKTNFILEFLLSFFLLGSKNKSKILSSGANSKINTGNNIKSVEYLSPGHMILKREVFFNYNLWFPNNFLGWSFGEGIFLTYQLFLKNNNSLVYNPFLKVRNIGKKDFKVEDNITLEKMKIIYRFIFWYKFIYNNNILKFLAYLWSQLGMLLIDVYNRKNFKYFKIKIKTYLYLIKNHKKIISNKKDFNEYIFF